MYALKVRAHTHRNKIVSMKWNATAHICAILIGDCRGLDKIFTIIHNKYLPYAYHQPFFCSNRFARQAFFFSNGFSYGFQQGMEFITCHSEVVRELLFVIHQARKWMYIFPQNIPSSTYLMNPHSFTFSSFLKIIFFQHNGSKTYSQITSNSSGDADRICAIL